MARSKKSRYALGCVLFALYLAALVYFLFFSEGLGRRVGTEYTYNLVPFREIKRFWSNAAALGSTAVLVNLFGNVLAFIPFGLFFPFITRGKSGLGGTTLATFLFSLLIECIQLVTRVGSFDVDDLLLNTLGGFAGALLHFVFLSLRRKKKRR